MREGRRRELLPQMKGTRYFMKNRRFFPVFILFLISFFAELFLFNYKHWSTLSNHEVIPERIILGDAYVPNEYGTFYVVEGDSSVTIPNLNLDLKSVYFNITVHNVETALPIVTDVYQCVTDEGNLSEYFLPVKKLWSTQPKSRYSIYHLYGNCTGLRFIPDLSLYSAVSFEIKLNPVIPISFSLFRMAGLFVSLCFFYLMRPSSRIYDIPYLKLSAPKRTMALAVLFFMHIAVFWKLAGLNPTFTWNLPEHHKQYQELAQAFREQSLALLAEPGETLKGLDNPYDMTLRCDTLSAAGEDYRWDTAFFQGKYYVYFGIVPVLLYYFPYHVLTGGALPNYIAVFFSLTLLLLGTIGTLHEIIRKWFPHLSLGIWFLTAELFLLGSNVVYMAKRPDLYTLPIVTGLALGMTGFWCFLKADEPERISLKYLSAGALLTALTAGCRPQLILFMVFPVILFRKYLFSMDFYRQREGRRAVLAAAAPVLAIAAFLMYYNYARFGSVFDFGASYNLTTNDMRYRGWVWGRIPYGIFVYLFQPVKLTTDFPFMETLFASTHYMGITIQEFTPGGLFATHLFAWLAGIPFFLRKKCAHSHKLPCILSMGSFLSALVILVADTEMSGILWRDFNDFSFFIMFAALLSVWMLFCSKKMTNPSVKRWFITLLLLCFVSEITFQGMSFFLDTSESLMQNRSDLFSKAMYLIAFWL